MIIDIAPIMAYASPTLISGSRHISAGFGRGALLQQDGNHPRQGVKQTFQGGGSDAATARDVSDVFPNDGLLLECVLCTGG